MQTVVSNPAADLDRLLHNWQSHFTSGRSPSTLPLAFLDWAAHAANSPFQTAMLAQTACTQWQRLAEVAKEGGCAISPQASDNRFAAPAWQAFPFSLMTQAVLLGEEWWESVVRTPSGVDQRNRDIVAFTVRQWLDLISPSNMPALNPEVIKRHSCLRWREPCRRNAKP